MIQKITFLLSLVLLMTSNSIGQLVPQMSTLAGNGLGLHVDGSGLNSSVSNPTSICKDVNNNLFVVGFEKIRKISPAGVVTTVFTAPTELVPLVAVHVDGSGNIYTTSKGAVVKVTGMNTYSLVAGNLTVYGSVDNNIPNQGSDARFDLISSICSDFFGGLYLTETNVASFKSKVRFVNPINQTTKTLYSADHFITSICFDNSANLIFDRGSEIVKFNVLAQNPVVTSIAGGQLLGHQNGFGSNAVFGFISGICVNSNNEIIVAEGLNLPSLGAAAFIALSGGSLNDFGTYVRKIKTNGEVVDIVGGNQGFKDAIGVDARMRPFGGVAVTANGDIYFADKGNHRVRRISNVTPPPAPTPIYIDLPASICLGSTVSQEPAITGSELTLKTSTDNISLSAAFKSMTKNDNFIFAVNANDNISVFSLDGVLVGFFPISFAGTTAIAADNQNRVYVVAADGGNPSLTTVYRTTSAGGLDFSWNGGQTTSGILNNVSTIAVGPDNIAYVADTTTGFISQLDTLDASVVNLPPPSNLQNGYLKPASMAFDIEGNMFLADIGNKKILKRNAVDFNYYDVYPGIENENLKIDGISFDFNGGYTFLSSTERDTVYLLNSSSVLDTAGIGKGFTNQSYLNTYAAGINNPKQVIGATGGFAGNFFIGSPNTNAILKIGVYAMRIAPKLPKGLFFDHVNGGKISGTPQVTAPFTTYTITTYGVVDSTQQTISFSVDPSNLTTNTIGNKTSPIINVSAGLSVNFYDGAGCEPLAEITPVTGAQGAGNIQITRTVEATLPSFSTGGGTTQFIRSKIKVSAQNSDTTNVNLVQYFTYQDIEHYNANNGAQSDLQNDTVVGTMPITIVQFHEKPNGSKEVIKHNVIAKWNSAKKVWKAEVRLTKFSEFFGTSQDAVTTFECESQESYEFAFGCASAEFGGQIYYTSGSYRLEYINQYGCDSIINLAVFLDNSVEIGLVGDDTLKLQEPAPGATFQWVSCDNNFSPIPGATNDLLVVADSGSYAVIVSSGVCIDTSNCAYVNFYQTAGIDENGMIYTYSIVPNPSKGIFVLNASFSDLTLEVFNMLGEKVLTGISNNGTTHINLNDAPSGMYLVKIQSNGINSVHRIVKE